MNALDRWKTKSKFNLFIYFCFFGLHLRHMEVARLWVVSELQLPTYATATAAPDLSCICKLHRSSQQRLISDPLSKARDWTCILMDTSWICFCCTTRGTPGFHISCYSYTPKHMLFSQSGYAGPRRIHTLLLPKWTWGKLLMQPTIFILSHEIGQFLTSGLHCQKKRESRHGIR